MVKRAQYCRDFSKSCSPRLNANRLQPVAARDSVWGYGVRIHLTLEEARLHSSGLDRTERFDEACPPIVIFGAN
jgi:hypothetical protein